MEGNHLEEDIQMVDSHLEEDIPMVDIRLEEDNLQMGAHLEEGTQSGDMVDEDNHVEGMIHVGDSVQRQIQLAAKTTLYLLTRCHDCPSRHPFFLSASIYSTEMI